MAEEHFLRDPEVEACLQSIDQARNRIVLHLSEARARGIVNPLDWRGWFRRYPMECTLGAVALGYQLGGASPRGGTGGQGDLSDDLAGWVMKSVLRLVLTSL